MGSVLIVESEVEFAEQLTSVLVREGGMSIRSVGTLAAAVAEVEAARPHVVVLGPSLVPGEAVEFAAGLEGTDPETAAVLVTATVTTDLLRSALRAGLRDVRSIEDTFGELGRSVWEAHDAVDAERSRRRTVPAEVPEAPKPQQTGGRVVTVFSTKGGVGKTVIATNLGVALAREAQDTILLDLDLQFGDTGIMLQLRPSRTIFDAMLSFDRLDAEMLRGFLTEHSSGLKVLLAPVHPEDAEGITASRVAKIIGLLREMADVVVVDTPGAFNDIVLAALDKSDDVFAVATMDVASIKNTRISLQKLLQLGYDDDRIRLVLNRADSKVWIEPGEVESAVEGEIAAKIPSDRLVPRSVNKGVPVVIDSPKSPVAKSLVSLARAVIAENGEVGTDGTEG